MDASEEWEELNVPDNLWMLSIQSVWLLTLKVIFVLTQLWRTISFFFFFCIFYKIFSFTWSCCNVDQCCWVIWRFTPIFLLLWQKTWLLFIHLTADSLVLFLGVSSSPLSSLILQKSPTRTSECWNAFFPPDTQILSVAVGLLQSRVLLWPPPLYLTHFFSPLRSDKFHSFSFRL